jgi:hypothetical protein
MSTITSEITSITAAIGHDETSNRQAGYRPTAPSSFAAGHDGPRDGSGRLGRGRARLFPLTVDFEERMYAAGKIPGGFIKREARPSEHAILAARQTDRPIRPLYGTGAVICTTLGRPDHPARSWAINGAWRR